VWGESDDAGQPVIAPTDVETSHQPTLVTRMNAERLDYAGTATSVLCAVHCAASPFVLPMLSFGLGRHLGPALEWGFAAATLVFGVWSLGHAYRAIHRDVRAILLFFAGYTTLMTARLMDPPPVVEGALIAIAGTFIIGAHMLNLRLRRARNCGCACACHAASVD
jgi:hypothetical protein